MIRINIYILDSSTYVILDPAFFPLLPSAMHEYTLFGWRTMEGECAQVN